MCDTVLKKIVGLIATSVQWGILGATAGFSLGVIASLLHIPPHLPGSWERSSTLPAAMILSLFDCLGGFWLAPGIRAAVRNPSTRKENLSVGRDRSGSRCGDRAVSAGSPGYRWTRVKYLRAGGRCHREPDSRRPVVRGISIPACVRNG